LRCYFVTKCSFVVPNPTPQQERDIKLVGDKTFLAKASANTQEVYEKIIGNVLDRTGPVLELMEFPESREKRLVIGYRQRSTIGFFSAMSDLYHYYELYSTSKYVGKYLQKYYAILKPAL
jgi:glutamate dehydrogenase